jgi:putative SOS response-associated peptidase YedK
MQGVPGFPRPKQVPLVLDYHPRAFVLTLQEGKDQSLENLEGDKGLHWELDKWGWSIDWGEGVLTNARSDSLEKKLLYRGSQVVLIPATSFYEYGNSFILPTHEPFYIAGLMKSEEVTVVTTDAEGEVVPVHSRMPLTYNQEDGLEFLHLNVGSEIPLILDTEPLPFLRVGA